MFPAFSLNKAVLKLNEPAIYEEGVHISGYVDSFFIDNCPQNGFDPASRWKGSI